MKQPNENDILDYMCFLATTAKVPKKRTASMLGICRKNVSKRANKGALWTDHFLAEQKETLTEIKECDVQNFDIENISEDLGMFN